MAKLIDGKATAEALRGRIAIADRRRFPQYAREPIWSNFEFGNVANPRCALAYAEASRFSETPSGDNDQFAQPHFAFRFPTRTI